MARRHYACAKIVTVSDALSVEGEKTTSITDCIKVPAPLLRRVPPGIVVVKSFDEEGTPTVEELFDCRKNNVTHESTKRIAVTTELERPNFYNRAVAGSIQSVWRAGGLVKKMFRRTKESVARAEMVKKFNYAD